MGANTTIANGDIFYGFDEATLANVTPTTGGNVGTANNGLICSSTLPHEVLQEQLHASMQRILDDIDTCWWCSNQYRSTGAFI